jgi:hypothetical protein
VTEQQLKLIVNGESPGVMLLQHRHTLENVCCRQQKNGIGMEVHGRGRALPRETND